jgi:disulfide bond formation protein DsbB
VLFNAKQTSLYVLLIVGASLVAAWIAQYIFGLLPCSLCLYQRYLYIAVLLVLGTHLFVFEGKARALFLLATLGLLLATAGVAFYQVAVEYHWVAVPKVCTSLPHTDSLEEFRKMIARNATPACDQVQFSLFGISMAGYNGLLSLLLSLFTLRGLLRHEK